MSDLVSLKQFLGGAEKLEREMVLIASNRANGETLLEFESDGIRIADAVSIESELHVGQKYLVGVRDWGIVSIAEAPFNNAALARGVFGYIPGYYGAWVISHVFADGRLRVECSDGCYSIARPGEFIPSRDHYFSRGFFVPPVWYRDTARCLNVWAQQSQKARALTREPDFVHIGENEGINTMSDEQAMKFAGSWSEWSWDFLKEDDYTGQEEI